MGRWLPKEERLKLGERAAHLRDVDKLQWQAIAERLGLHSGTNAVYHYEKYKAALLTVKAGMTFKQIKEFSLQHNIEPGWVWLYENGFRKRVPVEVQQKIENAKLSFFPTAGKRGRPRTEILIESDGKMGHRRSRQEQLQLGKRAVQLRDVEKLRWRQIAERLGVKVPSSVQIYYKKYKGTSPFLKEERY